MTVPSSPYTSTHSSSPTTLISPSMPQTPQLASPNGKEQRLIVVSNRLPVTISKDAGGEYHFKVSPPVFFTELRGG